MPVTVDVAARLRTTSTVAVRQILAFKLKERAPPKAGRRGVMCCSVVMDPLGQK
jgi:hypothetical protein